MIWDWRVLNFELGIAQAERDGTCLALGDSRILWNLEIQTVSVTWACLLAIATRLLNVYYAITNIIHKHSLASPWYTSSRTFFPFAHPPTPTLPRSTLHLIPHPTQPVEEDRWRGFIRPLHRPSPRGSVDIMSPASPRPIDYRLGLCSTWDCANTRKICSLRLFDFWIGRCTDWHYIITSFFFFFENGHLV